MKFKLFLFAALSLVLLSVVASAAISVSPSTVTVSASHNTDAGISFSLANNGSATSTLTFILSSNSQDIVLKNPPTGIFLAADETESISLLLTIPQYTRGFVPLTIQVRSNGETIATVPVNLTVSDSASLSITKIKDLTLNQTGEINVTNTGNVPFTGSNQVILSASGLAINLNPIQFSLLPGTSATSAISVANPSSVGFGNRGVTITAQAAGASASTEFNTIRKNFCRLGEMGGNLSLKGFDINNDGDKDDTWKPLDRITVEVDVENENDDEDMDNVFVELAIFDSNGKNVVGDVDFDSDDEEEFDIGDLSDGDQETATFEFLVPADFEEGNYNVVLKAYSDDTGESLECSETSSEEVRVEKEDDEGKFIAFTELRINPSEATCTDSVSISADTYNIGNDDEDRVRVLLTNKELGIALSQEIRQGLDQGDKQSITFNFDVPANAKDKNYVLELTSEYDYRNGVYREESDEATPVLLKVSGCSTTGSGSGTNGGTTTPRRIASISAALDSSAKAGSDLTITSMIRNLGTDTTTFTITPKEYDSWATLKDVSDRTITLNGGESGQVTIAFAVNSDAVGEQSFSIEAKAGSATETREVSVDIAKASGLGGTLGKNSTLLWVIGLVNVVLIILIIVVAVRIASRR